MRKVACMCLHWGQYLAGELASQRASTYTLLSLSQVTKLVRSGEVGGEERRRVFDAVGFSFINRLLATRESLCKSSVSQVNQTATEC